MTHTAKLLTYLRSQDLMSLATADTKPHIATVYYGIADDFTFFIVTPPSSKHGKHIAQNPFVACAVVDTTQRQFQTEKKIGAQIRGTSTKITDPEEMKNALTVWSKGREDVVKTFMKNIELNTIQSRPYHIKPTKITWFNEELFGEEGTQTFQF